MIVELAGRCIEIRNRYPQLEKLCQDYQSNGIPDFTVTVPQEDIASEREKSAREDRAKGWAEDRAEDQAKSWPEDRAEERTEGWAKNRPVRNWPDEYLETLAAYRKIAEKMPEFDTLLFHGSCIAVDGEGYLFTAKSGTGKSTHARLWREMLGERSVMVNDDKPLIRVKDDRPTVFGTPWDGKHRLSSNISVPLKALCVLERSAENHIERVTAAAVYPILLQQVYRPADPAALAKTLILLDRLAAAVPLYRLGCNMELGAAQAAYEMMGDRKYHEIE